MTDTLAGCGHAEHTTGFTGQWLGRTEPGGPWAVCPEASRHAKCFEKCSAPCPAPVWDDEEFYDGHLDYYGDVDA